MSDYSVDPGATIERLIAERDAALGREAALRKTMLSTVSGTLESERNHYMSKTIRLMDERDALQQRLTAADERADVLEGLLREVSNSCALIFEDHDATAETVDIQGRIDAALKPADGSKPTTCTWSHIEFSWSSACGMDGWEFTDGGTPAENGMKFCHCCGKSIATEVRDDE
ncbi:MAG: hypothetical protein [Caudoviricetes sp.]|nr:MAG: hypothetical protein [Caudoviricetes sp.]